MLKKLITRKNQEGASAIEYALIAGLIALAIIVGAGILGDGLGTKFTTLAANVAAAN